MASATRTLALATLALISTAATSPTNPLKKDDSTEVAGLNWSFYNIAALSGAVLVVSAGFAALVSIFLPLFAFTSCYYIFGTCRDTFNILEDFVIPRKVNKRSVEYLEPVLTTLANAYEKYADTDILPVAINIFKLTFLIFDLLYQLFKLAKTFINLFKMWYG